MTELSSRKASSQTSGPAAAEAGREQKPEALALVIPTLNEAGNIGGLLERVRLALEPLGMPYEIVVVDDDSRDGTGEIVSRMAAEDARIRLLVRRGERGLSGAILHGWEHTDTPFAGVMDADLQHPPELLPLLVAAILGGADLAIGSRYTPGGELGDWNPMRKFLSAAAVWVTWPIQHSGRRAKDPMSGFFLVRRRAIAEIAFQKSGFKLLLEVLVRARLHSVKEVPFAFGLRSRGSSKAGLKVGWDYARLLLRLYAARFFSRG
jgi:dolichol-phosphate mannosyltransferase